jgi:HSP20 family protein
MIGSNSRPSRTLVRARQYPMLSLFDEMNRIFEEAVPAAQSARGAGSYRPSIDVHETEREYLVKAEFPGLDASEISIKLRDNTLTLSGEKKTAAEHAEGDVRHSERTFGAFSRSIPFSLEIDEDNTAAEMKNGLLSIRVPKSPKVIRGVKKVSIKG